MSSETPDINNVPTDAEVSSAIPEGGTTEEAVTPSSELDNQGEAMMALVEDLPVSPGLGNILNEVEQPEVLVSEVESPAETKSEEAPAVAPEVALEKKEVPADILSSYQERFGIDPEELKNMEGFADLSRGQQKQVLENLSALVVGRIHEEAKDGVEEASKKAKEEAGFLGKIAIGFKESFGAKKVAIAESEKLLAEQIEKGGMGMHKDMMEKLVGGMKEYGPEIEELPNGDIRPKFLGTEGLDKEVAERIDSFNAQARSFSKVPYEWSLDTATSAQRESYRTEQLAFDMRKKEALDILGRQGDAGAAMSVMADIEGKVTMERFMQTSPDAVQELKNIKNQNVWKRAIVSTVTEKGAYAALGAVTRSVLGATLGVAVAPFAASISGGLRGYMKAKESLREQDLSARQGKEVQAGMEKTSKNMVEAGGEKGSVAKINLLMKRIDVLDQQLAGENLNDNEITALQKKKSQLTTFLNQRLEYTKEKISEGKMIFGEASERLSNQYELTSALARGRAEVEASTGEVAVLDDKMGTDTKYTRGETLQNRISTLLEKTDEEIKNSRNKMVIYQTGKAAVLGAGFAAVGVLGRDAFEWMHGSQSAYLGRMFGGHDTANAPELERLAIEKNGIEVGDDGDTIMEIPSGKGAPAAVSLGGEHAIEGGGVTGATMSHRVLEDSVLPQHNLENLGTYTPKPGDTMTSILRAKFPGITDTQIENLRTHDLKSLGISSGNLDKIGLKDNLDLNKIEAAIKAGRGTFGITHASANGLGKIVDAEHPDFHGAAHESTAPINTPIRETIEQIPTHTVAPASGHGGTPIESVNPQLEAEKLAHEQYLKFPERRPEIARMLGVSEEELNKKLGIIQQTQVRPEVVQQPTVPRVVQYPPVAERIVSPPHTEVFEQRVVEPADPRIENLNRVYEGKHMDLDTREQQALQEAEAQYQRNLQRLATRYQQSTQSANVRTVNRGIGQIYNLLSGHRDWAANSMTRELTGRVQGGITNEVRYEQSLENARIAYEEKIARTHESFARARINLDNRQMSEEARILSKPLSSKTRSS